MSSRSDTTQSSAAVGGTSVISSTTAEAQNTERDTSPLDSATATSQQATGQNTDNISVSQSENGTSSGSASTSQRSEIATCASGEAASRNHRKRNKHRKRSGKEIITIIVPLFKLPSAGFNIALKLYACHEIHVTLEILSVVVM